jgi:F0F1-type ATP synthase membrane subunit b/b'
MKPIWIASALLGLITAVIMQNPVIANGGQYDSMFFALFIAFSISFYMVLDLILKFIRSATEQDLKEINDRLKNIEQSLND